MIPPYYVLRIENTAVPGLYPAAVNMCIQDFTDETGGIADVKLAATPADAKKFSSPTEAMNFWNIQSETHPIRETDGKPNRPMTAFNIEVLNIDPQMIEEGDFT